MVLPTGFGNIKLSGVHLVSPPSNNPTGNKLERERERAQQQQQQPRVKVAWGRFKIGISIKIKC